MTRKLSPMLVFEIARDVIIHRAVVVIGAGAEQLIGIPSHRLPIAGRRAAAPRPAD